MRKELSLVKEYMVSLIFATSSSVEEDQLLRLFDSNQIELSYKRVDTEILWGLKSNADNKESIDDQIKSITSKLNKSAIVDSDDIFKKVYLDIGVCYDTYTCTVSLSNNTGKQKGRVFILDTM